MCVLVCFAVRQLEQQVKIILDNIGSDDAKKRALIRGEAVDKAEQLSEWVGCGSNIKRCGSKWMGVAQNRWEWLKSGWCGAKIVGYGSKTIKHAKKWIRHGTFENRWSVV